MIWSFTTATMRSTTCSSAANPREGRRRKERVTMALLDGRQDRIVPGHLYLHPVRQLREPGRERLGHLGRLHRGDHLGLHLFEGEDPGGAVFGHPEDVEAVLA